MHTPTPDEVASTARELQTIIDRVAHWNLTDQQQQQATGQRQRPQSRQRSRPPPPEPSERVYTQRGQFYIGQRVFIYVSKNRYSRGVRKNGTVVGETPCYIKVLVDGDTTPTLRDSLNIHSIWT